MASGHRLTLPAAPRDIKHYARDAQGEVRRVQVHVLRVKVTREELEPKSPKRLQNDRREIEIENGIRFSGIGLAIAPRPRLDGRSARCGGLHVR